jgi:hypothetical protein
VDDKITRTMLIDYIELMIEGEKSDGLKERKYEGLKIDNDLGEFFDFEIREISTYFKDIKMGCTE